MPIQDFRQTNTDAKKSHFFEGGFSSYYSYGKTLTIEISVYLSYGGKKYNNPLVIVSVWERKNKKDWVLHLLGTLHIQDQNIPFSKTKKDMIANVRKWLSANTQPVEDFIKSILDSHPGLIKWKYNAKARVWKRLHVLNGRVKSAELVQRSDKIRRVYRTRD